MNRHGEIHHGDLLFTYVVGPLISSVLSSVLMCLLFRLSRTKDIITGVSPSRSRSVMSIWHYYMILMRKSNRINATCNFKVKHI